MRVKIIDVDFSVCKYERNLGWQNLGEVLGAEKVREARNLGASILVK